MKRIQPVDYDADLKEQHEKFASGITRGLSFSVLRGSYGDCTNNGVTKNNDRILGLFVSPGKTPLVDTIEDAEKLGQPVLYIVNRHMFNEPDDWVAVPELNAALLMLENRGASGYMFGGNFIYTSDGRKPFKYPIPVHDRLE